MSFKNKTKPCCDIFYTAQKDGTDSEGYGGLLTEITDDEWHIGCDLPPIKFCPWCGGNWEKVKT